MTISPKTVKMLWGRAAALCSMEDCRRPLMLDDTETDPEAVIGEMCHIVAESEDGPRGRSLLSKDERNDYSNLLLLCRNHHGQIDSQPDTWPVECLKAIKSDHEKWVREQLPGYDRARQNDEETYADYVEEWARRCDLDNWTGWGSFVLGASQPRMTVAKDKELEELRRWLLNRIWPGRYVALERAFNNFRLVLQDLQNTFRNHAEKPTPDNDWIMTVKFYQSEEWNEERYERLGKQYDFHVDLVQDLFLELTRAANLICDEVRATILPTYRSDAGRLTAEWGPVEPYGGFSEAVIQYLPEERESGSPYPGLDAFKTVRVSRDRHFGRGTRS